MSLRSPDMAGVALGTAFSILLLASITQGLRDVEILHDEKVEGVVGQNVTLSCTVKSNSAVTIVNVEWRKNGDTKLAVYTPGHGLHLFWPNITMQTENKSMASHLRLCGVTTQDSGIYVCCITSFPQGSLCSQTVLKITDNVGITCDAHPAFEVHAGENVTIKCKLFPDAKYKWTKNEALVSDNESLELCFAADAHTGVYTLTVTIGDKAVHKEFVITVLTASTSSRTDLWTVPSPSNSTEEGGMESAGGGLTASPTAHTDVTWAAKMGKYDTQDDSAHYGNVTAAEDVTSLTNPTHEGVTVSPTTRSDPHLVNSSSDHEPHTAHNLTTFAPPDQQVGRNASTASSYGEEVIGSTHATKNESVRDDPGAAPTPDTGRTPRVVEDEGTRGAQSHLVVLVILVPVLVLIAAFGFLYLRQKQRKRFGLPPAFKPPPPPVKYTAAGRREVSTHPFARCNSVTQL
ncbi:uncharacterized protein AB9W97_010432 isoform 2-T4 [Spinachia spinachia]